jgi:hypothetical protein
MSYDPRDHAVDRRRVSAGYLLALGVFAISFVFAELADSSMLQRTVPRLALAGAGLSECLRPHS